jgi:hypothetical protein
VPLIGCRGDSHTVSAFSPDDVERATRAVDCFVEHDVVFKGGGPNNEVVVGILCSPNQPFPRDLLNQSWV